MSAAPALTYDYRVCEPLSAEEIKRLRQSFGLSQYLFARLLHVSKKTVEKWEQGSNPVKGGDAVLLSLLMEDRALAKKLLVIRAHNMVVPTKMAFFAEPEEKQAGDYPQDFDSRYLDQSIEVFQKRAATSKTSIFDSFLPVKEYKTNGYRA